MGGAGSHLCKQLLLSSPFGSPDVETITAPGSPCLKNYSFRIIPGTWVPVRLVPHGTGITRPHVWPCSRVQSWCACVCVCFCSQECPEQEPAFVDSSVVSEGFPGGISGKKSTCQRRRHKKCGFDPWVRKIPWRRKGQPTPVFLPGESHGQRSLPGKL